MPLRGVAVQFVLEYGTGLIGQYQFWRNQHALLCRRVDNYALQFLFDFEVAKALNGQSVAVIKAFGCYRNEGIGKSLHVFGGVAGAFGYLADKFFVVHTP